MKRYRFREEGREDVREDEQYGMLFASIAAYLRKRMEMDCRALVIIAVCGDGRVNIMNGGRSLDFDFNKMLSDLVDSGVDLNRPAEGGVH
jgi:hypothetical protein